MKNDFKIFKILYLILVMVLTIYLSSCFITDETFNYATSTTSTTLGVATVDTTTTVVTNSAYISITNNTSESIYIYIDGSYEGAITAYQMGQYGPFTVNTTYIVEAHSVSGVIRKQTVSLTKSGYVANVTTFTMTTTTTVKATTTTTTTTTMPTVYAISNGVWYNDNITTSGQAKWYSFYATAANSYYIWWNDSMSGSGTKTGDIKVTAYYSNLTTTFFSEKDSSYSTYTRVTPSTSGNIFLKVEANYSGGTGTFSVVYSNSATRP